MNIEKPKEPLNQRYKQYLFCKTASITSTPREHAKRAKLANVSKLFRPRTLKLPFGVQRKPTPASAEDASCADG